MKPKEIALKTGIPLRTVYRVIKDGYTNEATTFVETRGRPSKVTKRDKTVVVNFSLKKTDAQP